MVRDGKATSYTIMIDEAQRKALLELVEANTQLMGDSMPLEYWMPMLEELPANELESPNILHGFCL